MPRSLLKLRKLTRFKTSVIKPPRCFWSMTIFGELDPERRNALLDHLPVNSQKLITPRPCRGGPRLRQTPSTNCVIGNWCVCVGGEPKPRPPQPVIPSK